MQIRTATEKAGNKIANYSPLLVLGAVFFIAGITKFDLPWETKRLLIIIFLAGILITVLIACAVFFRRYQRVAVVTDFVLLLMVVSLSSVVPALMLGREFQILLLKFGAILFFSLLPGLLYLQFIVVKGKTLREEYVLNLFRLHIDDYSNLPEPPRTSIFHDYWRQSWNRRQKKPSGKEDRDNLYLRKFEGLYGEAITRHLLHNGNDDSGKSKDESPGMAKMTQAGESTRFRGENLLPVLSTTVLLSVCWAAVLQPEGVFNWSKLPATFALNNKPLIPIEALRFGFVGAYFFILQMLVRRYFQDDLKTSAYINALNRIILVILLVTAINIVWPASWSPQQQYALAFLIGIFPQIGVRAIQSLVTIPLRVLIPSLKTDYPLSDLDGLNIWYESRLLEESIEDMQNLSKANLVDVILRTRIPVDRLIDWLDQAHLYLHVPKANRGELRRRGIRTATALERYVLIHLASSKKKRVHGDGNGQPKQHEAENDKGKTTPVESGSETQRTERLSERELEAIVNILANEPNLYHVREWRNFVWVLDDLKKKQQHEPQEAQTPPPQESQPVTQPSA